MSELTNETLRAINKNLEEHLGLFSESEMERNQKTYCTFRPSDLHYIKEAVEELLQLRSLRDAGDEEVDRMLVGLMHDASLSTGAKETVKILRYIAIARGRTRTDAVNKAAEWAKECEALQAKIERLKKRVEAENGFAVKAGKMIDELQDEARKELHKAPGMEEVDFITKPYCAQSMQSACENHDKLADIARRSIASREEVVGLLKWIFRNQENQHHLDWAILSDESRRILEIVEGK